jgi:hypothetical protein
MSKEVQNNVQMFKRTYITLYYTTQILTLLVVIVTLVTLVFFPEYSGEWIGKLCKGIKNIIE